MWIQTCGDATIKTHIKTLLDTTRRKMIPPSGVECII